jgi:hypothetical protein
LKPKKWITVLLAIFSAPLAFLYVGSPRWALGSLVPMLVLGVVGFMAPGGGTALAVVLLSWVLLALWVWRAYRFAAAAATEVQRHWYSRWYGLLALAASFAKMGVWPLQHRGLSTGQWRDNGAGGAWR